MTRVYLNEQGSGAHLRGGRLEVLKDGALLYRLPIEQVEQLVVLGRGVQLSTALLVALAERGVGVSFVSRGGRFYAALQGGPAAGVGQRAGQYALLQHPAGAAAFARPLVVGKLEGQLTHLRRYPGLVRAAEQVSRQRVQAMGARDIDQLRGYEGAAAAAYWQALVGVVPAGWGFAGRRHHPPPDPINALLSFAYTLLLQEIVAAVHRVGLDVQLGALHPPAAARPSLALDLEEPLRPLGVDAWVFDAVRNGVVDRTAFTSTPGRVLLNDAGRRQFLALYEQQLARPVRHPLAPGRIALRQAVELHVRLAARVFTGAHPEMEGPRWTA